MSQLLWILLGVPLTLGSAAVADLKPLPSFMERCFNNSDLNNCMIRNMLSIRQHLVTGNEEFHVLAMEPFYLENFIVSEKSRSSSLEISANEVRIYNSTKYTPSNMKCEYGVKCTFELFFPNLFVTGKYRATGQFAVLPITGAGPMKASFDNVQTSDSITFGEREENGIAYGKVRKIKVHTKFTNGYMKLDNLFHGDKLLGEAVNEIINANLVLFAEDIKPIVEAALNREFRRAADRILRQYTIDQLFPTKIAGTS